MFEEHLTKKEKLFLAVLGILAIILVIVLEVGYRNDVETCVSHGHDRQVCETGLK